MGYYSEQAIEIANAQQYENNSDQLKTLAQREHLKIILPTPTELFIDIDNEEQAKDFEEKYEWMLNVIPEMEIVKDTPSKSGLPRRHIIIGLPVPLSLETRVGLQLALGSDFKHARLCLVRAITGDSMPITFLEKEVLDEAL